MMKRIVFILIGGAGLCAVIALGYALSPTPQDSLPEMIVYKSATCGCCVKWVEHMEESGFRVESRNMRDMRTLKDQLGVPRTVHSCHTAVIDGYVIEGHVPAVHVTRLLEEKPDILGIAVPGMPIGSPGMEGPNPEPYDVVTFNAIDTMGIYAHIEPIQ